MAILKIDPKKCICCGYCFSTSKLFIEDKNGTAKVAKYAKIDKKNSKLVQDIISFCPTKAISLIQNDSKYKNYKDLVLQMRKQLESITIPDVKTEDVKMDANAYYSSAFDNATTSSGYDYSSESKAMSAALNAFERECYTKYKRFMVDIFVQYKIDKLRPYYMCDETGYYAEKNKTFEETLTDIANEIISYSNGEIILPEDFCTFNIFPSKRDLERLSNFEQINFASSIWAAYRSGSYSRVKDYESWIDTDDLWVDSGFFGDKYKYCYRSWDAVEEFKKDMRREINYYDIDEEAAGEINWILEQYRKEVKEAIDAKCDILEKAIQLKKGIVNNKQNFLPLSKEQIFIQGIKKLGIFDSDTCKNIIAKYYENEECGEVQNTWGLIYYYGKGVTQNYEEAVKWFRKAAEQGHAGGQCNLGDMYEAGHGVSQNYEEAVKWYRKAAEQGDARGQCNLGDMYILRGNGIEDHQKAMKWYRTAAEQGDAEGQYMLGAMYSNDKMISQNYGEAVKWIRKAAEQGLAMAQCHLGEMYEIGIGVPQNIEKAIELYYRAAQQGDFTAQNALQRLGVDKVQ